jgi:hypothetical protein
MATYSRRLLSGSTDGLPIPISGTATGSANTVHTAVAGSTDFDEIYAWVSNVTAAPATLTVEWGSASDPGGHMVKAYSVQPNSPPVPIATGQVLNNAKVMKAFSSVASALNIFGFVNRISA